MKIAVLGTGMVGRALAARSAEVGHEVVVGTRDVESTLARTDPGAMGTAPYASWQAEHPEVRLLSLSEAAASAEVVLNAVAGVASLAALKAVGPEALAGKVLLDLAIPLDLSRGLPPTLVTAAADSLGEQVQRAFPAARVVKSLHTVYYEVMVDPGRVPGAHSIFVAGDDPEAKAVVTAILGQFGWPPGSVIDLGGIVAARATEMYSQLFFALHSQLGTFDFNINVVHA